MKKSEESEKVKKSEKSEKRGDLKCWKQNFEKYP